MCLVWGSDFDFSKSSFDSSDCETVPQCYVTRCKRGVPIRRIATRRFCELSLFFITDRRYNYERALFFDSMTSLRRSMLLVGPAEW